MPKLISDDINAYQTKIASQGAAKSALDDATAAYNTSVSDVANAQEVVKADFATVTRPLVFANTDGTFNILTPDPNQPLGYSVTIGDPGVTAVTPPPQPPAP